MQKCEQCGAELPPSNHRRFCDACRKKRASDYKKAKREAEKRRVQATLGFAGRQAPPASDIAKTNAAAIAHGMTYGQYVMRRKQRLDEIRALKMEGNI